MLTYDLQVIHTRAAALEADLVQKSEELKKYQHQLFEVYICVLVLIYIYMIPRACITVSLLLLCVVLKSGELKMYQQFAPPIFETTSFQALYDTPLIYDVIYEEYV